MAKGEWKAKERVFENRTSSKIPKTGREKVLWEKARELSAKEEGKYREGSMNWGLTDKIYKDEMKNNHEIKSRDIRRAHKEKAAGKYPASDKKRK